MQLSIPNQTPPPGKKTGWPFKVAPPATPAELQLHARIVRMLAVTRRQWWPD